MPFTGRCVDFPECGHYYYFDAYSKKCEREMDCPAMGWYWNDYAKKCVEWFNTECDTDKPYWFYGNCMSTCDDWKA